METGYTYDDVLIAPKYSEIESRRLCDTSVDFGKFQLDMPIFSANMRTVTGNRMATSMNNAGCMGILHRFKPIEELIESYCTVNAESHKTPFVSIGVSENCFKDFIQWCSDVDCTKFCIDVAHGHHIKVKNQLHRITKELGDDLKFYDIIVGNIATPEAFVDLVDWGATIVKVGIGPGRACTTRKNTGVGYPQLSALENIYKAKIKYNLDVKIIADGGIKNYGDIPKALKYADAVMLGSMLAGTEESPGLPQYDESGQGYKMYVGSASSSNKINSGYEDEFVEGISVKVPLKGPVENILKKCKDGLQSAMSYTGSLNIDQFKTNCEFIKLTGASRSESKL